MEIDSTRLLEKLANLKMYEAISVLYEEEIEEMEEKIKSYEELNKRAEAL